MWRAPYYAHEVVGVETLSQLANDCFGDADPGDVFYRGTLQEIMEQEDGRYLLRIPMPFVTGGDVKLRKRGDEMFITIGNFKREMILPTVLAKRRAGSGSLQNGMLEITFLPPEPVVEAV
jgi:arsenite/tail-anchored protein-transporting ATPase